MNILALYHDDNGEAHAAVFDCSETSGPFRPSQFTAKLEDFNDGGGLFLVELEPGQERPNTIIDCNGDEVGVSFYTLP
jgi:hypothetical protein